METIEELNEIKAFVASVQSENRDGEAKPSSPQAMPVFLASPRVRVDSYFIALEHLSKVTHQAWGNL